MPKVTNFSVALLLSAVVSAPWHAISPVAAVWGVGGLSGLVYATVVARRLRVQTIYQPAFEDWVFHILLPGASYAMLAGSAFMAHSHTRAALFVVGAATLLLLFVGIHNAGMTSGITSLSNNGKLSGIGEELSKPKG